jgi:hypothetical protein
LSMQQRPDTALRLCVTAADRRHVSGAPRGRGRRRVRDARHR